MQLPPLLKSIACAGLLLACSGVSAAAVVYHWETLDAKGSSSRLEGRLEIDPVAYRSGSLRYTYASLPTPCGGSTPGCPDPTSPVLRWSFGLFEAMGPWINHDYRLGDGFPDGETARFELTLGPTLDGWMDSSGTLAPLQTRGVAGIWRLDSLCSEMNAQRGQPICGSWLDVPEGVTGRWVLDRNTLPVHEPAPLALALAAGLAAAVVRRRR